MDPAPISPVSSAATPGRDVPPDPPEYDMPEQAAPEWMGPPNNVMGAGTLWQQTELWVWTLPGGETLSPVLQWSDLDVPETTPRIDLDPVRTAAAWAMPFWP